MSEIAYEPFDQYGKFTLPPDDWMLSQTSDVQAAVHRLRVCNETMVSAEAELAACELELKQAVAVRADAIEVREKRFPKREFIDLWRETHGRGADGKRRI